MERRIEWHCRASRRNSPQVGCHPTRMVIRQNGQSCSRLESCFRDPASNRFRHPPQFELRRMAESVGRWITETGFEPGARLAILADNHPRWVAAYLGTIAAGCTAVPLDTAFHAEQVAKLLRDSGASLLFVNAKHLEVAKAAISGLKV